MCFVVEYKHDIFLVCFFDIYILCLSWNENSTYANERTTVDSRKGVGKDFITAFRSSIVIGFLLVANGLLVLYTSINLFRLYYWNDWERLFEAITSYGLWGLSMALLGRVGGCIYTKVVDVVDDITTSKDILGEIILYKPLLENIIVYYIVISLINNIIILWKVASQVGPV